MTQVVMRLPGVPILAGRRIVLPSSITLNVPVIGTISGISIITGTGTYDSESGTLSMEGGTLSYAGGSISILNLTMKLLPTGILVIGRGCKTFIFLVCQDINVLIPYQGVFTRLYALNLIEGKVGLSIKIASANSFDRLNGTGSTTRRPNLVEMIKMAGRYRSK